MAHSDLASLLTARRGLAIEDLIAPDLESAFASAGVPSLSGPPRIVQLKQEADATAQNEFQSGLVSSIDLSARMTRAYESCVRGMVEQTGLGQLIRSEGYALASCGGFARANVGKHSDWDMVLVNEHGAPDLSHPALTQFSDLLAHGIEAKFLLRNSSMLADMLGDSRGQGIVSLTALLRMNLLVGDGSQLTVLERVRDNFLSEHFSSLVQSIDLSIQQRERESGALFRRAEFDLKESLGGLRDRDCVRWLDEIAQRVTGKSLLSDSDRLFLDNVDEVQLTAKHALHFSAAGGRGCQFNRLSYDRRERVLEVFGRASSELLPPRVAGEIIYSTALQVHHLLVRVLRDAHDLAGPVRNSASSVDLPQAQLPRNKLELGAEIRSGKDVARVIRALYENGDLARLLPDFEYAQFFVDRAGFHHFPLGEHQVRAVEELDRLLFNVHKGQFSIPEIVLPRDTAPLYLALLLHDVSKPDEGDARDHHLKGAQIAHRVALELGFSDAQAQRTRQLVEDHMLIANISSYNDIGISQEMVAVRISDLEYLQELLLLTLADKKESNPQTWRKAKEDRILNAYQAIKLSLVDVDGHADIYNANVQRLLGSSRTDFEPEKVRAIIDDISPHVLHSYPFTVLAEKIRLLLEVRREESEAPRDDIFRAKVILPEPKTAPFALYFVCNDSVGLLGRVSTFLGQRGMVLRSALVDTHDGLACDYLTIESRYGSVEFFGDDESRFISGLRKAILNPANKTPVPSSSSSTISPQLKGTFFKQAVQVRVQDNARDSCISVIIQDAVQRDIFPLLAPILDMHGYDIINAQIGCGNREMRHRIDLRMVEAPSAEVNRSLQLQKLHEELTIAFQLRN